MRLYSKTVDMMAKYSNTLGLLAASVSINADENINVAPVIKTVVRDLERHMDTKHKATGQRILPIGCDAASSGERDQVVLDYLIAGSVARSIDFWSCNNWSWAGESNMEDSGYNALVTRSYKSHHAS
ncbi:hypothetical protein E4T43_06393 [Aureobasidium subglaciale]|nr:hypothetical protein E4T43_06393 [Aureobasidium subglaciale]